MTSIPYGTSLVGFAPHAPLASLEGPLPAKVGRRWLGFWAVFITVTYALLWSANWYPLSDSSLYLSLGRSFAAGRGLTMMGDAVKLTPPLTPLLIALIIKLGGGMGVIQGVMLVLMLASHAFCFLALRRILGERLSLLCTIAGAMSYWVFANAFTIMSEPPALVFLWAGTWILAGIRVDDVHRWRKVIGACLLLLGAATSRDAVMALAPGMMLLIPGAVRPGIKFGTVLAIAGVIAGIVFVVLKKHGLHLAYGAAAAVGSVVVAGMMMLAARRRLTVENAMTRLRIPAGRLEAWFYIAIFTSIFGAWTLIVRYPPTFLVGTPPKQIATTQSAQPTTGATAIAAAPTPINVAEGDEDVSREGRYKAMWLYGVKRDARHLLTEPPVLGGRWVCEGLIMPTVAIFEAKSKLLGGIGDAIGVIAFILFAVGLAVMVYRGHWWLLGVAVYFLVIWLQWGTRLKPRYMVPIAPMLFLCAWAGLTTVVTWGRLAPYRDPATTRAGWRIACVLCGLVLLGNAFPWYIEFQVRHARGEFYDLARRGAFAKLVDIGAWAQVHIGPTETIWMNAGAQRRIAYLLTGRRIETHEAPARYWSDWDSPPGANEKYAKPLRNFRRQTVPPQDRFIIVYCDHPVPNATWPGWHWPWGDPADRPQWWRLFARTADNQWVEIAVPKADRSFVAKMPPAGR